MISALLMLPVYSQDLSKKEQKAAKAQQMATMVSSMIQNQRFVLEATVVKSNNGKVFQSSPILNYIAVDSLTGVCRLGSFSSTGANSIGPRLVEGNISNYQFTRNKKNGRYHVTFNLRGTTSYEISMTVHPDGKAKANLHTQISGSNISYSGNLVPPVSSRAHKDVRL